MSTTIVKKLSTKAICGNLKTEAKKYEHGEKVAVARIYGMGKKAEPVETDYGTSYRFTGEFEGVNHLTGEVLRSTRLFLPEIAEELFLNALYPEGMILETINEQTGEIETNPAKALPKTMAFDFTMQIDDTTAAGYVFSCTPLIQGEESDPLKQLASSLPSLPEMPKPATALADGNENKAIPQASENATKVDAPKDAHKDNKKKNDKK